MSLEALFAALRGENVALRSWAITALDKELGREVRPYRLRAHAAHAEEYVDKRGSRWH